MVPNPTSQPWNPGLTTEPSKTSVNKLDKLSDTYPEGFVSTRHLAEGLGRGKYSVHGSDEPQGTKRLGCWLSTCEVGRGAVSAAGKRGALVPPSEGTGRRPCGAREGKSNRHEQLSH